MFGVYRVINAVQMNRLQFWVCQENERGLAFVFENPGRLAVLRINDPDARSGFELCGVIDQLPELVITPCSPLAAHKDQHDRLAFLELITKRVRFSRFVGERKIRRLTADGRCGEFVGMFGRLFHFGMPSVSRGYWACPVCAQDSH